MRRVRIIDEPGNIYPTPPATGGQGKFRFDTMTEQS